MDRLVIFFRDQTLSIEQHKDFGRRFGQLHMHPASPDVMPDHPEVLVIKADDKAGASAIRAALPELTYKLPPADGEIR
jgi:taurine dioxygenase